MEHLALVHRFTLYHTQQYACLMLALLCWFHGHVNVHKSKCCCLQGWTEPVPTGLYFQSSHYSTSQGQLVTNQLTSNQQNLALPCLVTLSAQYDIGNAIATLAYGESIRVGKQDTKSSLHVFAYFDTKWVLLLWAATSELAQNHSFSCQSNSCVWWRY